MKNWIIIVLIGIIFIFFNSCNGFFEQKDFFEDSSAVRLENFYTEARNILTGEENGWVMDYFTVNEHEIEKRNLSPRITRGYTFIMRFYDNDEVKFMSKTPATDNKLSRDSCLFEVKGESGPILTFNTASEKNDFHAFSSPETDGAGYKGDYEFIVLEYNKDQVKLKGKKRGTYIYLNRLPEDITWENYFENLDNFQSKVFTKSPNYIKLVSDNTVINASSGIVHRFTLLEEGTDPMFNTEYMPFIIYPDGLRFQHPFSIDGKIIQTFKINDDWSRLVCTNEGSTGIYFEGPNACEYFYNDNTSNQWKIDKSQSSSKIVDLYDELVVKCRAYANATLNTIYFSYFRAGNVSSFVLGFQCGSYTGRFYFEKELLGDNKILLKYKQQNDSNGDLFLKNVPLFYDLIELMNRTFIVTPNIDCSLNLNNIKIVASDDPEINCILFL